MADQASSQFRKEATPILEEYRAKVRQAFSYTAGRGFMSAPGFLFEAQSMIEYEAKRKLSEINYNILAAQIELELKQSGMAYDIAHRNAVMDWEMRKQGLFSDWEKELAYMKRDMSMEEQDLQALAREVARRGILLEEARSAIALEREELRKQIEELGGETAEYEVALANARMLTTQKKLEVLPYLEQLVVLENQLVGKEWELISKNETLMDRNETLLEKEQELQAKINQVVQKSFEVLAANEGILEKDWDILDKENERAPYSQELIEKETELSEKRRDELGPAIDSLVEVYERYANEIEIQTFIYSRIADVKGETAKLEEQRLERLDLILDKQRELARVTGLLVSGQQALAEHQARTLLPAIGKLTEAYERLLVEIEKQIKLKLSVMNVRKETEEVGIDQVKEEIKVSQANLNTELARKQLAAIRADREDQQKNIEEALLKLSIDSIRDLMDAENISEDMIRAEQATVNAEEQGSRLSLLGQALVRALTSHQGLKNQEIATTAYIAGQDALQQRERAIINATPKITAQLEHLLSM